MTVLQIIITGFRDIFMHLVLRKLLQFINYFFYYLILSKEQMQTSIKRNKKVYFKFNA